MIRELLIDDSAGYIRAAVIEDGKLCEIHGERLREDDQTESLFLGRIQSIKPSISAAFVDIGTELNAFLPFTPDMNLRCGDMIIVQGQAKQATDTKGLRITNRINLAGKWLVLIPDSDGVHISKKVKDPSLREELLAIGKEICPSGCSLIIRTASEDVTAELLAQEASQLHVLWQEVKKKAAGMTQPGLLHRRLPLSMRLVRDMRDLIRIVTNSKGGYDALAAAQMEKQISSQTRIEYFDERNQLIFDAFGIEPQIDKALGRRVWLPGGGYLIIDYCEAMTVIDVNSGKMVLGRDLEETALRVNLEAADEIARQLRLRDIGGIVIVDFIDMHEEMHKQALVKRMRDATSKDRLQVSIEGLTRLGLLELSRKRAHAQLHQALCTGCSYCSSTGEVLAGDETARRALRQVRRMLLGGQCGPFLIRCAPAAAQALSSMPAPGSAQVYALAVFGRHAEKYDIEQIGAGMPFPKDARALKSED